MYCNRCGAIIKDGSKFCAKCGAQTVPPKNHPTASTPPPCINGSQRQNNYRYTESHAPNNFTPRPQYESSSEKGGAGFLLFGIVLNIVGLILIVYGSYKANDWVSQVQSIFTTGYANNGMAIMTGGIVLMIIGGILDFIGVSMRRR